MHLSRLALAGRLCVASICRSIVCVLTTALLYAPSASAEQRWALALAVADVRGSAINGGSLAAGFGVEFSPALVPALSVAAEVVSGSCEFPSAAGSAQGSIGTLMVKAAIRPFRAFRLAGLRPFLEAGIGDLQAYAVRDRITLIDRAALASSVGVGMDGRIQGRASWRFEVDRVFDSRSVMDPGGFDQPLSLWRVKAGVTIRLGS